MQLHKVISNIIGDTGIRIIEAILKGERDPNKLASLRGPRIKNSSDTIAKALNGDYREEHIFTLKQEYDLYNIYQEKIQDCDKEIEKFLQKIDSKIEFNDNNKGPKFNLEKELYRISGEDFTKIPGFDVTVLRTIFSEVGLDISKWKSEKHFSSWLGLSPANKITGEKIFSSKTRKVISRAATAFRLGAFAALKSKTAIGAHGRRLKSRLGAPKSITAIARKLACLFYNMMKYGKAYVEQGMEYYEQRYQEKVVKSLQKRAKELGFSLVKTGVPVAPSTC